MGVDPRFSVVLATTSHDARGRLLRLLTERFSVRALRGDAAGACSAVRTRSPDVLVCDPWCGADVLALLEGRDVPPATWLVVLADGAASRLPHGVIQVAPGAAPWRVLDAVAAAGRFARAGAQPLRVLPAPVRIAELPARTAVAAHRRARTG